MGGRVVMKQFSLEEYLKNPNQKVVTRDGHPVRIICTDHDNISYPIVGAIKGYNFPFCFGEDGYVVGSKCNDANDLFFASEKKIGWINVWEGMRSEDRYCSNTIYASEEEAKGRGSIATVRIEWEE